ncbi:ImpA family metalloprotease [Acinetobacter terrestris]|uniref:ImpA family metalloprotease n=1 Tax=Acinetobacter terrestris TaxID=2529843 RepID=UPI0035255FCA
MEKNYLRLRTVLLTLSLSIGLISCGGGGGSDGTTSSPVETPSSGSPPVTPLPPAMNRIDKALSTGDATPLTEQDATALLDWALQLAKQQQTWQKGLLTTLYIDGNGKVLQPKLQFTPTASINLYPYDLSAALPIAVSDKTCGWNLSQQANKGCGLGVASQIGKGRALAFGQNMFAGISANNPEIVDFAPVLNNGFRWLLTGKTQSQPKQELKLTVNGLAQTNLSTIENYFSQQLGVKVSFLQCNVLDQANTCWKDADLMILGSNIGANDFDSSLIQEYLDAGKPIYFQAMNTSITSPMGKIFSALRIESNNNIYRGEDTLLMSAGRSITDQWNKVNDIDSTIQMLEYFKSPSSARLGDLNANNTLIQTINKASSNLQSLNAQGISAFSPENNNQILKALVLLADVWRPSVNYSGLSKNGDALTFMRTYASDSWTDYKRKTTLVNPQGAGDYMPAAAQNMAVSAQAETISVTIPQGNGITAIGRASISGKPVSIEIVDAQGTQLSVQTSYLRAWGNPFDDGGYKRPRRPNSFAVKLDASQTNDFISPFGGPLMLNYSNAKAGSIITLKIKGAAKYAHYDFTQDITEADISEATSILQSRSFGWNTFKFVGGEIQQTNDYALKAIGNSSARTYVDQIKAVIFDSNHIANGYNNIPLDNTTVQRCTELDWDCTGSIHRAPNVQHFVGWIATCGFLCSGNPSDGSTGLDTGWGWVHELGHNTVQNVLTMVFPSTETGKTVGCVVECNNNILAGLSMMRKYYLYAQDSNGSNFRHPTLYANIKDTRSLGLSGEAQRAAMEKRLWQDGYHVSMQAFHIQMALNYTRLRQGKSEPDLQGVFEFMRLLNTAQRLYNQIDLSKATQADKNKLGLGAFNDKNISRPDLIYVLTSKIMGYDLKDFYTLYGLPVTATAHASVAMLNLPRAPLYFYAQPEGGSNRLATGQWLTIPAHGPVANYSY